jgi:hypothetical protein
VPRRSASDVPLGLAHEHVRRQTRVAHLRSGSEAGTVAYGRRSVLASRAADDEICVVGATTARAVGARNPTQLLRLLECLCLFFFMLRRAAMPSRDFDETRHQRYVYG